MNANDVKVGMEVKLIGLLPMDEECNGQDIAMRGKPGLVIGDTYTVTMVSDEYNLEEQLPQEAKVIAGSRMFRVIDNTGESCALSTWHVETADTH